MPDTHSSPIWLRILALLSLVFLACGAKNYLAFLVAGTDLCPYLCPSLMGVEWSFTFPPLDALFSAQTWVLERLQAIPGLPAQDPHKLTTSLVFAPLLEETIYRGPMYLTRRMPGRTLWWSIGIFLCVVFALSHGRSGLALAPLVVLGVGGLWLIATTHRFWPSLALHFLHNFFFASVSLYQSIWISD